MNFNQFSDIMHHLHYLEWLFYSDGVPIPELKLTLEFPTEQALRSACVALRIMRKENFQIAPLPALESEREMKFAGVQISLTIAPEELRRIRESSCRRSN